MTHEEFSEGFNKLAAAFTVAKPEQRARAYWEELQDIKAFVWMDAVKKQIRQGDRFPTLSTLLNLCNPPNQQEELTKQPCDRCDGFGWVMFQKTAYRGRCEHGKRLSDKIRFAPESHIDIANETRSIHKANQAVYGPEYK